MTTTTETSYEFTMSSGSGIFPDMLEVGKTVARKTDDSVWVIANITITDPDEDNDDFDYTAYVTCRPATESEIGAFREKIALSQSRRDEWKRLQAQANLLFADEAGTRIDRLTENERNVVMWEKRTPREYGSVRFSTDAERTRVWRITNYYDGYDLGMEAPAVIREFDITPERAKFLTDLAAYRGGE